jgi:hypothetical protein
MPLPQKHLKRLQTDLKAHERELEELERKSQHDVAVRSRIEFHRVVLNTARDPKILRLLDQLNDDTHLAVQLADNSEKFIEARGVRLPPNAQIAVLSLPPEEIAVALDFHLTGLDFRLEWSKEGGFVVRQLPMSE